MSHSVEDPRNIEAAVIETMVLLSTLSAAAEVRHAAQERRAGRDPSEQEAAGIVRPFLRDAQAELEEMFMRLRAGAAHARSREEAPLAALVRRYDDLMTLHRAGELLGVVHQRLLSLYPEVSEDLVEDVRLLQARVRGSMEAREEAFPDEFDGTLDEGLVVMARVGQALGAA